MDTAQLTILIVNMVGFATILLALFAAMLLSHTLYKRLDAKMETPFRRLSDVLDEMSEVPQAPGQALRVVPQTRVQDTSPQSRHAVHCGEAVGSRTGAGAA